ncbi:lysM domain-containing protein [Cinnamomum micranthum f. kanehirae]|uniref:LysM domain-containing protein n=1 Tax=Cinnamomum micranthum f. kanehirae TaxID=337451 RepID=A0A3S3M3K3_9MAGN|nr:lysM domain-containing protein [Cinnamomum micranthum f. kanehirae]
MKTTTSQSLLLLLLLLLFFPFLVPAKFVIEPCDSSNSCQSLLSYRLPFDSKLSEIASRFQTDVTQILESNGFDPTDPLPGNQILSENTVVRVPIWCPCVDGIRRSVSTVYTVEAIDTVDYIAVGYGGLVSADQIREANKISDWDRIYLGQRLVIPLPCFCFNGSDNGLPVVYMSYVVKQGESLKSIGRNHGTTVTDLVAVNGLGSALVNTGDVLAIPIPACSSAYLNLNHGNFIVPNASYALTAYDCVQCTCGPKDLILRCFPSPFATNCNRFKCRGTNLYIGEAYEERTMSGCNVMKCLYRGYHGHKILSSLSYSTKFRCSGNRNRSTLQSTALPEDTVLGTKS